MKETISQIKNSLALKVLVCFLLLTVIYKTYVWTQTESTDNAYVQSDISTISSQINGVVVKLVAYENSFVKAGDIIAEIDDRDYVSGFEKSIAALEIAQNNLQIVTQKIEIQKVSINILEENLVFLKVSLDVADKEYKRILTLSNDSFSSKKLFDQTKLALEQAKFDLSECVLNLDSAQKTLALLQFQKAADESGVTSAEKTKAIAAYALENTKIRSPIDGFIGNNSIKVGNYISTGVPIVLVTPEKGLYVQANFKETQIRNLKPGSKAVLQFDSVPGVSIDGVVRNISAATGSKYSLIPPDNATGNFTKVVQRIPVIDFEVPNEVKDKIKTGMSVTVSIRK